MFGDLWIGPTEAVGELFAKLGSTGVAHDGGRHGGGPAHMIAVEKIQQFLNLIRAEAAGVAILVDVPRRRADQYQTFEEFRGLLCSQDADHGAHRMADKDTVLDVRARPISTRSLA